MTICRGTGPGSTTRRSASPGRYAYVDTDRSAAAIGHPTAVAIPHERTPTPPLDI